MAKPVKATTRLVKKNPAETRPLVDTFLKEHPELRKEG